MKRSAGGTIARTARSTATARTRAAGSRAPEGRAAAPRMRAASLAGPRAMRVERVPLPEPGPGEVRVRLEGSGLCASSLPVWQGRPWFEYPQPAGAPGHEGWGVVEALGEGVTDRRVGERVAALSFRALAEYDVAAADAVVPLPDDLDGEPFPGEALGCAMNVYRRSDIHPGQTVAVVGVGFLGAVLVALAEAAGARVIAVSRRPFALAMAREFGAAEIVTMDDHADVLRRVQELTDGKGCERVIEVVGQQWPLDLAGEMTGERGRLVIAGYHQDGPRQVNLQLWNWRGLDVVNAHERDPEVCVEGMSAAVEAVTAGVFDPAPLYTHHFGLDELDQAFAALETRPEGFLKALVTTS